MSSPRLKTIALLLAALVLSACAERWQKPGASEQDAASAAAICQNKANERFPPYYHYVYAGPDYFGPPFAPFYPRPFIGPYPPAFFGPGDYYYPTVTAFDANQTPRREAFRACMFEGGWRPAE